MRRLGRCRSKLKDNIKTDLNKNEFRVHRMDFYVALDGIQLAGFSEDCPLPYKQHQIYHFMK